jgi:NADH dehydrogenase (ubiquinone) Fe-S protein 1
MEVGFCTQSKISEDAEFLYLLGADEISKSVVPQNAFVVYQGHHGDAGAQLADVILPGAAYTEKTAIYVNTEGRPQQTTAAVAPPENAREDWKIIRALSEFMNLTLPYDSFVDIRYRVKQIAPHLVELGAIQDGFLEENALEMLPCDEQASLNGSFNLPIKDYYLTDVISRNSPTMAKCSYEFTSKRDETLKATQ